MRFTLSNHEKFHDKCEFLNQPMRVHRMLHKHTRKLIQYAASLIESQSPLIDMK